MCLFDARWNWLLRNMDIEMRKCLNRQIRDNYKTVTLCLKNSERPELSMSAQWSLNELPETLLMTSSIILHLIVDLSSTYQAFSGVKFSTNLPSIHSSCPIYIFLNDHLHWISKLWHKLFCTRHQTNASCDLQNYRSMTIVWEDYAKTSSEH